MKISPARQAAFKALTSIDLAAQTSSAALAAAEEALRQNDKALCHRLVLGVLRKQLYLDHLIDALTGGKKLDGAVRVTLRLGLFQLLFLDRVPAHSAINESVELVHRAGKTSAKGLVNAVLRRAAKGLPDLTIEGRSERNVVELSHPKWLLERWEATFGLERAIAIARANDSERRTAFRAVEVADIPQIAALDGVERSSIAPNAFVGEKMSEELRGLNSVGKIVFQEEASQLVGSAIQLRSGDKFLDVCAAPGNKTLQAADSIQGGSAQIIAGDVSASRIERLKENLARFAHAKIDLIRYNAASASLPFEESSFDVVFVDAPCTGTGTIASNPEIRYRLAPSDILRLQNEQRSILESSSKMVKRGGTLYYATCSLEAEENEEVATEFLKSHPDFVSDSSVLEQRFLTSEGFFRTFPDIHGVDGVFLAALGRT